MPPEQPALDTLLSEYLGRAGVPLSTLSACSALASAQGLTLSEALVEGRHLELDALENAYARLPRSKSGPLHIGELISGRYRVEALLGKGGMGAVYRVLELSSQRALALKAILPDLAEELDLLRFQREGEVAARLSQAGGFVRVHSGGEHRKLLFFVMDLVEGRDLESALLAGMSPEDLALVLESVARSLQPCHEAGLVHRDLKPANILLGPEGPKVADLGLVRDRDAQTLTQTGEILGTPAYMAPEQVLDARSVDARTDVYALGAILYRGLSGRPPFSGSLIQVLDHIVSRDPPPPSELAPTAPRALEQVCLRALAKAPQDRYASSESFADDLQRALRGDPLEESRQPGSQRSRLSVALVIVLVIGLGAWLLRGGNSQVEPSAKRRFDPRAAAQARLREGYTDLLDPRRTRPLPTIRERADSVPARAARAGLPAEEIAALKLERWRAQREAWRESFLALAQDTKGDPAALFVKLRTALAAPPAVLEGVAGVTSGAFLHLLREGDARRAVALQMARRPLELEAPTALKELVYERYKANRGQAVFDCLRVDVPIATTLAVSRNQVRLELADPLLLEGLHTGQLRGYLKWLLDFSRRNLPSGQDPEIRSYLARNALAIEEILRLPPDLGRRAELELRWQRLSALFLGAELALLNPSSTKVEIAKAKALLGQVRTQCEALMRRARGPLVAALARVASSACLRLGIPLAAIESWLLAARLLEAQRGDPPFRESAALPLGEVLRELAIHRQTEGDHEAALDALRRSVELLPAICERMEDLKSGLTPERQERYLGRRAQIAIRSCLQLGRLQEGEEILKGCLSLRLLRSLPALGEGAVDLALSRRDFSAAEARITLLEEAGAPPETTKRLRELLAQSRAQ